MTVSELITILGAFPPDLEVTAGEWVAPSQLGTPKIHRDIDYCSPVNSRLHIFAPHRYQLSEAEIESGRYKENYEDDSD